MRLDKPASRAADSKRGEGGKRLVFFNAQRTKPTPGPVRRHTPRPTPGRGSWACATLFCRMESGNRLQAARPIAGGYMYPEIMVIPMREELVRAGIQETRTAEDVDAALAQSGTTLLVVNSICGCAAGKMRPGVRLALSNTQNAP